MFLHRNDGRHVYMRAQSLPLVVTQSKFRITPRSTHHSVRSLYINLGVSQAGIKLHSVFSSSHLIELFCAAQLLTPERFKTQPSVNSFVYVERSPSLTATNKETHDWCTHPSASSERDPDRSYPRNSGGIREYIILGSVGMAPCGRKVLKRLKGGCCRRRRSWISESFPPLLFMSEFRAPVLQDWMESNILGLGFVCDKFLWMTW